MKSTLNNMGKYETQNMTPGEMLHEIFDRAKERAEFIHNPQTEPPKQDIAGARKVIGEGLERQLQHFEDAETRGQQVPMQSKIELAKRMQQHKYPEAPLKPGHIQELTGMEEESLPKDPDLFEAKTKPLESKPFENVEVVVQDLLQ